MGRRSLLAYAFGSQLGSPFDGRYPAPLPSLSVSHMLARMGLDRLLVRQTTIDTTVVAREVNKGQGLTALLNLAGQDDLETIAIGDSEPDLAMFSVAGRCFAPANIACSDRARLLGCHIAGRSFQRGLLAITRRLVHWGSERCCRCPRSALRNEGEDLFVDLLRAADRPRSALLMRALFDPKAYRVFVR